MKKFSFSLLKEKKIDLAFEKTDERVRKKGNKGGKEGEWRGERRRVGRGMEWEMGDGE